MSKHLIVCANMQEIMNGVFIPIAKVSKDINEEKKYAFRYLQGWSQISQIINALAPDARIRHLIGTSSNLSELFETNEFPKCLDIKKTQLARYYASEEELESLDSFDFLERISCIPFGKGLRLTTLPAPVHVKDSIHQIEFFANNIHKIKYLPSKFKLILEQHEGFLPISPYLDGEEVKFMAVDSHGFMGTMNRELYRIISKNTSFGCFGIVGFANVEQLVIPKIRMYFKTKKPKFSLYSQAETEPLYEPYKQ